jgi:hypothetical protein
VRAFGILRRLSGRWKELAPGFECRCARIRYTVRIVVIDRLLGSAVNVSRGACRLIDSGLRGVEQRPDLFGEENQRGAGLPRIDPV